MNDATLVAATLFAALGSGLVAGIFFAFSAFVMAALTRLPSAQGIAAMQSINVAVLNPWFFAVFFGTAAVCAGLVLYALLDAGDPRSPYLVVGSLLYLAGTIVVTMAFNVPLNQRLAAVGADAGSGEAARQWSNYISVWTAWNHVRTAASLAAAAVFIMALR